MKIKLNDYVKNSKRYKSSKKQKDLLRKAANMYYDLVNFKNGVHFVKHREEHGKLHCFYRDNTYFEAIKHDNFNMTITRAREKNISNESGETFAAVREVFCNETKSMIDKIITIKANEKQTCHVSKQKITRGIYHHEILRALSQGIRVTGSRPDAYFYFANDIKVVASETEDEIRIKTAIRISTLSEKGLKDIIPRIVDRLNKDCHGTIRFELRDEDALKTWQSSPEFIKMKELEAIRDNKHIPDSIKNKILNAPSGSGFYSVYEAAKLNLIMSSVNARNISYSYPAPGADGGFSIDDFCPTQLSRSARIAIYVYLDSEKPKKDWSTIKRTLKRLGAKTEDLAAISIDYYGDQFIKINPDSLSGNFDERFECKNVFDYLVS
tara:strand:- start:2679 stop:3821 length:1143 start_codon:yes stop_codon:yes gene_type:complete